MFYFIRVPKSKQDNHNRNALMIAIQYNTFSDNVKKIVDYDKMLVGFEIFN